MLPNVFLVNASEAHCNYIRELSHIYLKSVSVDESNDMLLGGFPRNFSIFVSSSSSLSSLNSSHTVTIVCCNAIVKNNA